MFLKTKIKIRHKKKNEKMNLLSTKGYGTIKGWCF
nr:MAG TPA: hypothetical protein [Caudoviricetes sp.]